MRGGRVPPQHSRDTAHVPANHDGGARGGVEDPARARARGGGGGRARPGPAGRHEVTERTEFSLAVPLWGPVVRPLMARALADTDALRDTIRCFVDGGRAFTIATDGPEMMHTHLRDEFELLERIGALTEAEIEEANARGHAASFVDRTSAPVSR